MDPWTENELQIRKKYTLKNKNKDFESIKLVWVIYALSLILPAGQYEHFKGDFSTFGAEYLFFGFIDVLASSNFAWLANPLFLISFFLRRRSIISLVLSILTLYVATLVNEHEMWMDGDGIATLKMMGIGYYVWLSAFIILIFFNLINLYNKYKNKQ